MASAVPTPPPLLLASTSPTLASPPRFGIKSVNCWRTAWRNDNYIYLILFAKILFKCLPCWIKTNQVSFPGSKIRIKHKLLKLSWNLNYQVIEFERFREEKLERPSKCTARPSLWMKTVDTSSQWKDFNSYHLLQILWRNLKFVLCEILDPEKETWWLFRLILLLSDVLLFKATQFPVVHRTTLLMC